MKLIAGIVLLFIEGILADEPKQVWINNEFYAGGIQHKILENLARGVSTEDLIKTLLTRVDEAIDNYVLEYHQQLFHGVPYMISSLEEAVHRILQGRFDREKQLQKINELSLKVVKSLSSPSKFLEELPSPRGPVLFRGIEEENEILSNFNHLIDRDISVILNVIDEVYLAGWQKARSSYNYSHFYLKNKFLNEALLPAFARELEKLNEKSDNIRDKVSPETWRDHVNQSALILSAFDDLKNVTKS